MKKTPCRENKFNCNRLIAILASFTFVFASHASPQKQTPLDLQTELEPAPSQGMHFVPPSEDAISDDGFGDAVRLGRDIFVNTKQNAPDHVGNGLACANCHLNHGRNANSAPLWGAIGMYPAFRKKNGMVNTIQHRIQGCFRYSLNGVPPEANGKVMTALVSYMHWMSKGVPLGEAMPGRGYPKLEKPALEADYDRGAVVFNDNCALCHGANGEGTRSAEAYAFPPLWGPDSFNWGAGMHRVNTAAGFIKANMPYGKGGSLSDQQAWDVALYMNSQERSADPRYEGDFAALDATYHKHQCSHGDVVGDERLGERYLPKTVAAEQ